MQDTNPDARPRSDCETQRRVVLRGQQAGARACATMSGYFAAVAGKTLTQRKPTLRSTSSGAEAKR